MENSEPLWGPDRLRAFIAEELTVRQGKKVSVSRNQTHNLLARNADLCTFVSPFEGKTIRGITEKNARVLLDRIKTNKRTKPHEVRIFRKNDAENKFLWRASPLMAHAITDPLNTDDLLRIIRAYFYPEYTSAQLHSLFSVKRGRVIFTYYTNPHTGSPKRLYKGSPLDALLSRIVRARELKPCDPSHYGFVLLDTIQYGRLPVFKGEITDGTVFDTSLVYKNIWIEDKKTLCYGHIYGTGNPVNVEKRVCEKRLSITETQIDCVNWILRSIDSKIIAWRYLLSLFNKPEDTPDSVFMRHQPWILERKTQTLLQTQSVKDTETGQDIQPVTLTLYDDARADVVKASEISFNTNAPKLRAESKLARTEQVEAIKKTLVDKGENIGVTDDDFKALEKADKEHDLLSTESLNALYASMDEEIERNEKK